MFKYLITITGLLLAGCAAFFSVKGLSDLFVGGGIIITIMASILEMSKILTVSILERYWNTLSKMLRGYLVAAVVILMLITSAGIYGLLASGYQATFNEIDKSNVIKNSIEDKIKFIDEDILKLESNLSKLNKENLSLRNERENLNSSKLGKDFQYEKNGVIINSVKTLSRNEINNIDKRVKDIGLIEEKNKNVINVYNEKINLLRDSIGKLKVTIVDNNMNSNISSEIGSLMYLSELTGKPMNVIVNYLILLIIFIFDPLAVTLIIVANKLSFKTKEKVEEVGVEDNNHIEVEKDIEVKEVVETTEQKEPNIPNNINITETAVKNKKTAKDFISNDRNFSVKIPNKSTNGGNNTIQRI